MSKKEQIRELEIKNNDLQLRYKNISETLLSSEKANVKLRKENDYLRGEIKAVKEVHDYVELNDFRKKNIELRKENEELLNRNRMLVCQLNRLGFSYAAALSLGAKPNPDNTDTINNLISQREKMKKELLEKDYVILQLSSALEAAKVI